MTSWFDQHTPPLPPTVLDRQIGSINIDIDIGRFDHANISTLDIGINS